MTWWKVRPLLAYVTARSSARSLNTYTVNEFVKIMSQESKPLVAAGFIIFRKTEHRPEYLFLQTSYGKNHWTPPKGHVDPGESEFETALRETEEEAGIRKDQMKVMEDFQRTLSYDVNGKSKRVVYWLSELRNPEDPIKLSHEHTNFKWDSVDGACKLAQFPDMVALMKEVDDYLRAKV